MWIDLLDVLHEHQPQELPSRLVQRFLVHCCEVVADLEHTGQGQPKQQELGELDGQIVARAALLEQLGQPFEDAGHLETELVDDAITRHHLDQDVQDFLHDFG